MTLQARRGACVRPGRNGRKSKGGRHVHSTLLERIAELIHGEPLARVLAGKQRVVRSESLQVVLYPAQTHRGDAEGGERQHTTSSGQPDVALRCRFQHSDSPAERNERRAVKQRVCGSSWLSERTCMDLLEGGPHSKREVALLLAALVVDALLLRGQEAGRGEQEGCVDYDERDRLLRDDYDERERDEPEEWSA